MSAGIPAWLQVVMWLLAITVAIAGLGVRLLGKPHPRLARWLFALASALLVVAAEMTVCNLISSGCPGWWSYGIGGVAILSALFAVLWPELRMRRRQRIRVKEVAAELRDYLKKLEELYHKAKDDSSTNDFTRAQRAADRADKCLVPWKESILEHLDAAVSRECAMQCYRLGTALRSGAPGANAKSSYEVHRGFLEKQLARIEQGKVRLKDPPESSGEVVPHVKSFVYPPQP